MAYEVVSISIPDEVVDCAVAIARQELDAAGVIYDIQIEPSHDPEDPQDDAIVIWAYLRSRMAAQERSALGYRIDQKLAEAGLSEEDWPLEYVATAARSDR